MDNPYFSSIVARNSGRGVLIDTNLMILLVIGNCDPALVSSHKRTKAFTPEDFATLLKFVEQFQRRITLPNIVTEVDNLSRQCAESLLNGIASSFLQLTSSLVEVCYPSRSLMALPMYVNVGITDSAIIQASEQMLVLTDDFRLGGIISSLNRDVVNFNHLRFAE